MSFWTYILHCNSISPGYSDGEWRDIIIGGALLDQLKTESRSAHPAECCGILLGTGNAVYSIQPTKNIHSNPRTHFEVDPAALIAAYKAEREGGLQVLGFYHSHPNGLAQPSPTDQAQAAHDGKIWAIIAADAISFWRDGETDFTQLSYSPVRK